MLRFFYDEGYKSKQIKIEMPHIGYKRLLFLSIDELKEVIKACNLPRDKAIILLCADSGIRRAELCNLNWGDIDLKNGIIRILQGKGRKYRTVIIGLATRKILKEYKESIDSSSDDKPVFQVSNGKRITVMGLRSLFIRLGGRAKVKVTPHSLRRTFATLSLKAGMNLIYLQSLMGHSSLEMTKHYIQLLDEDLLIAHQQHGPIDNLLTG
jgi:integrase